MTDGTAFDLSSFMENARQVGQAMAYPRREVFASFAARLIISWKTPKNVSDEEVIKSMNAAFPKGNDLLYFRGFFGDHPYTLSNNVLRQMPGFDDFTLMRLEDSAIMRLLGDAQGKVYLSEHPFSSRQDNTSRYGTLDFPAGFRVPHRLFYTEGIAYLNGSLVEQMKHSFEERHLRKFEMRTGRRITVGDVNAHYGEQTVSFNIIMGDTPVHDYDAVYYPDSRPASQQYGHLVQHIKDEPLDEPLEQPSCESSGPQWPEIGPSEEAAAKTPGLKQEQMNCVANDLAPANGTRGHPDTELNGSNWDIAGQPNDAALTASLDVHGSFMMNNAVFPPSTDVLSTIMSYPVYSNAGQVTGFTLVEVDSLAERVVQRMIDNSTDPSQTNIIYMPEDEQL